MYSDDDDEEEYGKGGGRINISLAKEKKRNTKSYVDDDEEGGDDGSSMFGSSSSDDDDDLEEENEDDENEEEENDDDERSSSSENEDFYNGGEDEGENDSDAGSSSSDDDVEDEDEDDEKDPSRSVGINNIVDLTNNEDDMKKNIVAAQNRLHETGRHGSFNYVYEEDNFQKFSKELTKNIIADFHPECKMHNEEEIKILSEVTRNKFNVVCDVFHRTLPFLSKYEKARVLGMRAKQLDYGAPPMISNIPEHIIDGYSIAQMELEQKRIPFIIRRPVLGGFEYWKISDLEIL